MLLKVIWNVSAIVEWHFEPQTTVIFGLHSFWVSLDYHLKNTPCRILVLHLNAVRQVLEEMRSRLWVFKQWSNKYAHCCVFFESLIPSDRSDAWVSWNMPTWFFFLPWAIVQQHFSLIFVSGDEDILKWRGTIRNLIFELFSSDFLFVKSEILAEKDVTEFLQKEFLTYDKNDHETWTVHLLAGILLLYWNPI